MLAAGRRSCWRLKPSLSVITEPLGRWKPLAEGPSSSSSGVPLEGRAGAGTAVVSEASSTGVADDGVVSSVPSCSFHKICEAQGKACSLIDTCEA